MLIATGALLLIAAAVTFVNWRWFLYAAIPVALLQDPLRKLTTGQPVVYVVLVGIVVAAALLVATMSGVSVMPGNIRGWRRRLGTPFALFLVVLVLQAFNALVRFDNVIIPSIGLLFYLTPFVALGLVYQAVIRSDENLLPKFLQLYVFCVSLALLTIGLQYIGYKWPVLGEVGAGITMYDRYLGNVMSAYSGLFRASEIAAWHAATCACFLIILTVSRRTTPLRVLLAAAFVLIIIGLGMLTGRRKFLVEILVFASAYATLLFYFDRGAARLALLSSVIGLLGFIAVILFMPEEKTTYRPHHTATYEQYVGRTKSVFADVPDRLTEFGLAAVGWAYNKYGLLGAGLGAGSQGVEHFGVKAEGAAEGGLGKLWVELGAPGFVVVAWFCWALGRHLWGILKGASRYSRSLSRLALGLASFLVANVACFVIATQAYGDVFILLLLGTALGALLAMPVLAERALQRRILSVTPSSRSALVARPA